MANDKWVADARQLLKEIERIYEDHYSRSYNQCVHDIFNAMRRIVRRNATFRTVEVVHGRWSEADDGDGAVCSVCGEDFCNVYLEVERFKYCPNCGAKMKGE